MKVTVDTDGMTYSMTGPKVRVFHWFKYVTLSNGRDKVKIPRQKVNSITYNK